MNATQHDSQARPGPQISIVDDAPFSLGRYAFRAPHSADCETLSDKRVSGLRAVAEERPDEFVSALLQVLHDRSADLTFQSGFLRALGDLVPAIPIVRERLHAELQRFREERAAYRRENATAGEVARLLISHGDHSIAELGLVRPFLHQPGALAYCSHVRGAAAAVVPDVQHVLARGDSAVRQLAAIDVLAAAGPAAHRAVRQLRSFLYDWSEVAPRAAPWRPFALGALSALGAIGVTASSALLDVARIARFSDDPILHHAALTTLKTISAKIKTAHGGDHFTRGVARLELVLARFDVWLVERGSFRAGSLARMQAIQAALKG